MAMISDQTELLRQILKELQAIREQVAPNNPTIGENRDSVDEWIKSYDPSEDD